jgi:antitoxin MazE
MRSSIVRIGNSRGLRLPKPLLLACGIHDQVELSVQDGRLIVEPLRQARQGWAEAASQMAGLGDDEILVSDVPTTFDSDEWEW